MNITIPSHKNYSITVIIPSLEGNPEALLSSLEKQTWQPNEVKVVVGVSPNGLARNSGVSQTTSNILLFIDDDAVLGNDNAIEQLVYPLLDMPHIQITGASKLIPPNSNWFQRWVAREVPRIEHPIVSIPLETNPDPPDYCTEITTTCCAMRRVDFEKSGGFNEVLIRGVDTEFFARIRQIGFRFLLIPNTWTWHPAPANFRKLLRKHFLYGRGHAQEIANDSNRARRVQKRPLLYLIFRTLIFIPNIFLPYSYHNPKWKLGFKPLKAVTSYTGVIGFFYQAILDRYLK